MILLISYDLLGHERPSAYEAIEKAILDNVGRGNYIKPLFSQYLVDTTENTTQWSKIIKGVTDNDDCWLITRVTSDYAGTFSSKAVNWLKEHI
jgi:hypothetical protein